MARWTVVAALVSCLLWPAVGRADCAPGGGRTSDLAFGDSYSDVPRRCPEPTGPAALHSGDDLHSDGPSRPLRHMGVSGMGAGVAVAGVGGAAVLASWFMPQQSFGQKVARVGGIGLAIGGGALFVTGAILALVDLGTAPAPAPTPDGRGGQLVVAGRF